MSIGNVVFVYEFMELEKGVEAVQVVIDAMFGESLENLINDIDNEVGHSPPTIFPYLKLSHILGGRVSSSS